MMRELAATSLAICFSCASRGGFPFFLLGLGLLRGVIAAQILHQRAKDKEEQNTRVGPSDNLEQSKEKNYPPTSLVACCICSVSLACWEEGLTLRSVRTEWRSRDGSRRAGDRNPGPPSRKLY
jgi:hypothetical protein